MDTQAVREKLKRAGRAHKGSRQTVIKRYKEHLAQEGDAEEDAGQEEERGMAALASENPFIVMLDEENGNRYMRSVDKKGLGEDGDLSWLVQDMHQELKSWGYPGGGTNALILKSDGESDSCCARGARKVSWGQDEP